ncbi:MAG: hypothetical protein FWG62_06510 [Proteobacteria bacterium]|nr:hypothetical protein [Pseudomonadota bacterium]
MLQLTPLFSGSFLAAAALGLAIVLLLTRRQRTMRRRQIERIRTIQRKIGAALEDGGCVPLPEQSFSTSLKEASLTTRLQQPRLDAMGKTDRQTPEKYRILAKLADQGMDSVQIAAILGISSIEAAQLLNLCQMTKIGR